jgi:hypothetical protein
LGGAALHEAIDFGGAANNPLGQAFNEEPTALVFADGEVGAVRFEEI